MTEKNNSTTKKVSNGNSESTTNNNDHKVHLNGLNGDHASKPKSSSSASSPSNTVWNTATTAIKMAVLAVVLHQILTFAYVAHSFSQAINGPFGASLAVADEMSIRYPAHFWIVQHMVVLPIPNYAARAYYEEQRPFFEQAAREFELHPYWSRHMDDANENMTFREAVTERMKSMHQQFVEDNRMDYRLEKDRCAQFDFFEHNDIPHPAIKKRWYSHQELLNDVQAQQPIVDVMDHWPIFFKACHLTQRSSLGTFAVSSQEKLTEETPELVEWINDKWTYRSRDTDRPWQKEGDAMTDELTPSILLQEPMRASKPAVGNHNFALEGRVTVGLVELKVEVIWGKVYLMQLDAVTIFRRDQVMENYKTFQGAVLHIPETVGPREAWIVQGGFFNCVVDAAEHVAQAAHIEYVRVDVFLDPSDPANCQVNEISLSSGYAYYGHEHYMTKLWAGPLRQKMYKVYDHYDTPVYELSNRVEEVVEEEVEEVAEEEEELVEEVEQEEVEEAEQEALEEEAEE